MTKSVWTCPSLPLKGILVFNTHFVHAISRKRFHRFSWSFRIDTTQLNLISFVLWYPVFLNVHFVRAFEWYHVMLIYHKAWNFLENSLSSTFLGLKSIMSKTFWYRRTFRWYKFWIKGQRPSDQKNNSQICKFVSRDFFVVGYLFFKSLLESTQGVI